MKHYDISYAKKDEDYKGKGFGEKHLPPRTDVHVDEILAQYTNAIAQDERALRQSGVDGTRDGYYLQFRNMADFDFALNSIDNKSIGHMVSVKEEVDGDGKTVTSAILYLKKDKRLWLNKKANEYKTQNTKGGNKKNMLLIDTIEEVRPVTLDSLWHGKGEMPTTEKEWVELWFSEETPDAVFEQLRQLGIEYKEQSLEFPERIVVLARTNRRDLERVFYSSSSFLRCSSVPTLAGFIADEEGPGGQQEWMKMIMGQYHYDRIDAHKYFCILDSGVSAGHPMLLPVLSDDDRQMVLEEWGTNDKWPHGTMMAGLAAYGDLTDVLANKEVIEPEYRLCSVKVASKQDGAEKEFWAHFTKRGVYLAEIQHGNDVMGYCMAVAEDKGWSDGTPSSWSGAIDQICSGDEGHRRLFVQCAGNVDEVDDWKDYPNSNKTRLILNPGQAWNALTVGAYTEKVRALDDNGHPLRVLAPEGGLSPFSTTSLLWAANMPIKPEIVMEGGNLAVDANGTIKGHNDLELLTTSNKHVVFKYFSPFNATSAATAMAARYAAIVSAENPNFWPETVRGLFVHTAQWTSRMMQESPDVEERMRIYGYGVPNLMKMLESRKNGVTFIAQNTIQPYKIGEKGLSFNKMHIYTLPWPKDVLERLGEKNVKLTITLSYYIEPGPTDNFASSYKKYNYASAGLRFELSTYRDSAKSFKSRILKEYDEDEVKVPNDTHRWGLGISKRTKGSVHKDWIECMAVELAQCNMIAVFPVSGWWYKRKGLKCIENTMRYSLIVSLECGEAQVDFSTEIETKIPITQQIEVGY